jgi:hypothetical protein
LTDFKVLGKVECPKTIFYVRGKTLKEAIALAGHEFVIFWIEGRLLCTTLKDVLSCPRLLQPGAEPDKRGLPQLNVVKLRRCIEGYVQCHWWFLPESEKCKAWAQEREVANSHLGKGLYEKLLLEFFKDGQDTVTQDWRAARMAMG